MFLGWYFLYVAAAAFAREFMAYRIVGNVNVALVFGVLQFVSAFVLAWRYTRYARQVLDPLAAQIVADAEERVGEAVRRRAGASPGSPTESSAPFTGGGRPYLGPTPPDGLGVTPPDGMESPRDPATPPRAPWPETAGRPWTGGTR
ncbi:hypothetical protein GCM10023196_042360 [Actinoallomurus vinaceus]|uniref:DUF485 domain-containing protein n=1 Tax=Actinoallomurus vinaceus TaxID=1080074 RepID=A0ABP8UAT5_9ACTN